MILLKLTISGLILFGQPVGISAFQILSKHWTVSQCRTLVNYLKNTDSPATSILWGSFGSDLSCLNHIIKISKRSPKHWWVQIHLSNEAGRRNKRLTNLDLLPELSVLEYNRALEEKNENVIRAIIKQIKEIRKITDKNQHITWNLSLGLESNFTRKAAKKIYKIVQFNWPYDISYSSIFNDKLNGAVRELHGYGSTKKLGGNCIRNGDGTSIINLESNGVGRNYSVHEIRKWYNKCRESACVCLFWANRWQGILSKKFIRPDRRNFIFRDEDINLVNRIIGGQNERNL
jgi:hypothetical protein